MKADEGILGLEADNHSNLAQLPSAWLLSPEQHNVGEGGMVCQGRLAESVVIGRQKIWCDSR